MQKEITPEEVSSLSSLLQLGIQDLRQLKSTPGYAISMGEWVNNDYGLCYVCLGGAVLARRIGQKDVFSLISLSELYPDKPKIGQFLLEDAIKALNYLRQGAVTAAAEALGVTGPTQQFDRDIPSYHEGPVAFLGAITKLQQDLAEAGL